MERRGGDLIIIHDDEIGARRVPQAPGTPGCLNYPTAAASPVPCHVNLTP
jgi:hypothetical protein